YTPISCGILAGVGFGFLGFALFMVNINAKPTLGIEGEYEKAKVKFVNLSPGILVIMIAALLIGFCISRYHAFEPKVFDNWNAPETENNAPDIENNVPDTEKK
ncbi:MAG: hypothetical protein WBP93_22650, partial [Pyrinomonadaceae bacterium]